MVKGVSRKSTCVSQRIEGTCTEGIAKEDVQNALMRLRFGCCYCLRRQTLV